jgi:3-dehydroquinate synthase
MTCAARLAERLGRIDSAFVGRQESLLAALGLPVQLPPADHDALVDAMARDKKTEAGRLRFVLPDRLGHVELVAEVAAADVRAALAP